MGVLAFEPRIVSRPWRLALLAFAVLWLHAWLLGSVHLPQPAPRMVTRVPPISLRPVVAQSSAERPVEKAQAPATPEPEAAAAPERTAQPAAREPEAVPAVPAVDPAAAPAPPDAPAGAALASGQGDLEVPVYATRLPAAARWTYRFERPGGVGRATLSWQPEADHYQARFEATLGAQPLIEWNSIGAIDGAGIAPERFVDRRRGRGAQAANFQRDAGKITFSGPAVERPLPAGAQDRLTWMLQLAGVVAAEPARWQAGQRILLYVSGARGDAEVWTFVVQGLETVDTGAGAGPALKLLREPQRPYDTRAEVWLDPRQQFVPVRARLLNGDTPTELTLTESVAP